MNNPKKTEKYKHNLEDYWMFRAPLVLKNRFDDVLNERVKKGKANASDKKKNNYKRVGLALAREPNIWDTLKKADFIDDKNGQISGVFNIFTFIIVAILVVMLFAGWIYVTGLLNSTFMNLGAHYDATTSNTSAGYVNLTLAATQTFGVLNSGVQALYIVAAVYVLGFAVAIIVTNALMKLHPLWFFAYVLISGLAIIFSAPVSNAYQNLLGATPPIFGGVLNGFTIMNYILINLPGITMIVSIIGAVFLFINLIRGGEQTALQ